VQTRRDLLQAYRFQTRRAVAALVTGNPNVVEPPMRRLTVTTISGIMIAILVGVGFALFGFFRPASTESWRAPGSIIVENETGARYVLLGGVLHPVLNYPSAVLAVGTQNPHVVHVARADLDGVRRGLTIGIPQAPDSLPAASDLAASTWSVCSRQQPLGGSGAQARVSVSVGGAAGARPLASGSAVVAAPAGGGSAFLLLAGRRYAISSPQVATALNVVPGSTLAVGRAFLDAIPAGPTLRPPVIHGSGSRAPYTVDGNRVRVGQLLATGENRNFLVLPDGVSEVNGFQFALLQAAPIAAGGRTVAPLHTTLSSVLPLPHSAQNWTAVERQFAGLPTTVPSYASAPVTAGGMCAVYRSGALVPAFAVPPSLLSAQQPVTGVSESAAAAAGRADSVVLRPGSGALVQPIGAVPTVYVIAGTGQRFAAASRKTLAGFGYGTVRPTRLPESVIALVPAGPALDPSAARRPYGG
jgi:type VII secretion protein EccB